MDRLFPLTGQCNFVGRRAILDNLSRNYQKELPSHIQVIGPHYTGKTALLKRLEEELNTTKVLDAVVYWDLSGLLPANDDDFLFELCKHLGHALSTVDKEASEMLLDNDNTAEGAFDFLCELANIWEEENKKLLVIMDGFEKPINSGTLTANLWDRLRHIANDNHSIRLLTGSRDSLRETVRDPASQKSPFFNIFDPSVIRVGCFNDEDLNAAFSKLTNSNLNKGAISELLSQSNGFPLFVLETLNNLTKLEGTIDNNNVIKAAESAYEVLEEKLEHIWQALNTKQREIATAVLIHKQLINAAKLSSDERNKLVDLGFVKLQQNKLQSPSKLAQRFLESHGTESTSLISLFGTNDNFVANFTQILEIRLGQIPDHDFSRNIKKHIKKAIEDLPQDPEFCVKNLRGILDETLEKIWGHELDDGKIPQGYFDVWEYNKENIWPDIKNSQFVGNRGAEMHLLDLLTGTMKTKTNLAKDLTKRTVSLITGIHQLANFGQHRNGTVINVEFAFSALYSCIEMLNSLVIDFEK